MEEETPPFGVDEGNRAFYGPKNDLKVQDALGREWQPRPPSRVHRALFGSAERFFALLVEHYAGAFPLWLAPVQVSVVPVTDAHLGYARTAAAKLKQRGMRVSVDDSDARMSGKIRTAQIEKIPYVLVVGRREAENETVSVRSREGGDMGAMTLDEFLALTKDAREMGTAAAIS